MAPKENIVLPIFKLLKVWAVLLLIFLNILGPFNIESVHHLLPEHKNIKLHTAQDERDPCHIKLFHQESGGGCDHTSHFVKEDKCPLCDIQFHSNPMAEVSAIVLPPSFNIVSVHPSLKPYLEKVAYQFTGRAPPVC